jgi:hydroxymethylbilane synthase
MPGIGDQGMHDSALPAPAFRREGFLKGEVLTVGTRGSALARWQAEHVVGRLQALAPDADIRVRVIKTEGDSVLDRPLAEVGSKGLFVHEIEEALLAGDIDLAVHSLKDLPGDLPEGLMLGAILERADPRDALLTRQAGGAGSLAGLPAGARVGTSSLRRRAQVLAARPDVQVLDLRGNVDTRLAKLERGEYDAVVLAVAGLERLGREPAIAERLSVTAMVPAPGQGALAVEVRAPDEATAALVARLDHGPTRQATTAERCFQDRLGGGCQAPAGAYAGVSGGQIHLVGLVISPDGRRLVRGELPAPAARAAWLGQELAARLLAAGGAAILKEAGYAR